MSASNRSRPRCALPVFPTIRRPCGFIVMALKLRDQVVLIDAGTGASDLW